MAPMDIDDLDWHDLNIIEKNKAEYRVLSANKWKKLVKRINDYASIYKHNSKYFCLDNKLHELTYFMKYQVGNNGKIGDYVWQSLVWTNPIATYIEGYPQQMFFEFLLPKFGTIITDSEQTWNGKRFWIYRIQDAFNMGLNVYFYDFSTQNIIKMQNYQDFVHAQRMYDIWGDTNKHLMKRMLLTNKELPLIKR